MMMRSTPGRNGTKSIPPLRLRTGKERDVSPGKSSIVSANSRNLSQGRREKLLSIQKRERLTDLLVHKFGLKYGKTPAAVAFIDDAVKRFVKRSDVTEGALTELEKSIRENVRHLRRRSRQDGGDGGDGRSLSLQSGNSIGNIGGSRALARSGSIQASRDTRVEDHTGATGVNGGSMQASSSRMGQSNSSPGLASSSRAMALTKKESSEWAIITQ